MKVRDEQIEHVNANVKTSSLFVYRIYNMNTLFTGNIFAPGQIQAFANFENDLLIEFIPYVEAYYPVVKKP